MREIHAHGPIACSVDAEPMVPYMGGIIREGRANPATNHVVSLVGWGTEQSGQRYWIARNSWGESWGEMGFFRVAMGSNLLRIENDCAWATPHTYTVHNYPCWEDGANCIHSSGTNSSGGGGAAHPYGYGDDDDGAGSSAKRAQRRQRVLAP